MAWCLHIDQDVFWRKHILPTRNALRRLVDGSGGGFLDQVDLRSGHGRGGDEGAVLGTDHGQVALSTIGTVLSGLEFALEATHLGDALLRALFLFNQLALVGGNLLVGLLQGVLEQLNVLLVLLDLDVHLLDGAFLLAQDLDGLRVSIPLAFQLGFDVAQAGLQLADDATASGNGVDLNLLKTN